MKHNPLSTLCLFVIMALAVTLMPPASAADVPIAAAKHRDDLTREARAAWGLEAPVATFAAQVHQESAWRADARSRVGAAGLAQVMPATATWIAEVYPVALGEAAPYSPGWALRALVTYDRHLFVRTRGHTNCDRWWFTLRGYNGGLGHLQREARLAADPLDRHAVDAQCGRARRGAVHCPENLGYPRRILYVHQARYAAWGTGVAC